MARSQTIGFIGAGNMAGAIIKGLASLPRPPRIVAWDPAGERLKALAREHGVKAVASNKDVCRQASVVILAVKPRQVNSVLKEISGVLGEDRLLVSIAAGVNLFQIESRLASRARLVRVMPNTPLLVGRGMSALTFGSRVREEDKTFVRELFGSVGRVVEVEEKLMDAVTALSGSGPAYVFAFVEGLADGGVKAGLGRSESLLLAAQTVAGAAEMVLRTGLHPGVLKDMVASPGGTTISGLHVLEQGGLRGLLISAVEAGCLRARQIGEEQKS